MQQLEALQIPASGKLDLGGASEDLMGEEEGDDEEEAGEEGCWGDDGGYVPFMQSRSQKVNHKQLLW